LDELLESLQLLENEERANQQPSLKYTWGRFRDYLRG
jgi:hypothetical protein